MAIKSLWSPGGGNLYPPHPEQGNQWCGKTWKWWWNEQHGIYSFSQSL